MLATITGNANIAIETDEAQKLATAMQRVARHYDVPGMKQETLDWIGLIQTAGAIYGSRIMAAKMERAAKKAAEPAKPEPIRPKDPTRPQQEPQRAAASIPGLGSVSVELPN